MNLEVTAWQIASITGSTLSPSWMVPLVLAITARRRALFPVAIRCIQRDELYVEHFERKEKICGANSGRPLPVLGHLLPCSTDRHGHVPVFAYQSGLNNIIISSIIPILLSHVTSLKHIIAPWLSHASSQAQATGEQLQRNAQAGLASQNWKLMLICWGFCRALNELEGQARRSHNTGRRTFFKEGHGFRSSLSL